MNRNKFTIQILLLLLATMTLLPTVYANDIRILTFNIPMFSTSSQLLKDSKSNLNLKDWKDFTKFVKSIPNFGQTNNSKRARKFANLIKKMNLQDRPHVITLQEIWENKYKRMIRDLLKKEYPYSNLDTDKGAKNGIGLNSGLMTLSMYPIKAKYHHTYKKKKGEEKWAKKGIQGNKILFAKNKTVFVFTTHLQSKSKNRYEQVKLKQLEEARNYINGKTKNMTNYLVVLTGDFNLSEWKNKETITKARAIFSGMIDTYDQSRCNKNLISSTWDNLKKGDAHKIDHAWILKKPYWYSSGYSCVIDTFNKQLSDHLAVKVKLNLKK